MQSFNVRGNNGNRINSQLLSGRQIWVDINMLDNGASRGAVKIRGYTKDNGELELYIIPDNLEWVKINNEHIIRTVR